MLLKTIQLLFLLAILPYTSSFSQKNNPKNLKQTIKFLDKDCPDSLKSIIKITKSKDFKELSYPWGNSEYKTIYNWLENENSKINKYLASKGINNFQVEVILDAFKKYLSNEPIIEDSILKPYLIKENKWKAEDENRSVADTLRGVYIPKNLEDCFAQINSLWSDSTKTKVKNWSEREFMGKAHLGFGMWMRNNWQLWGGSRLSKYFNNLGVFHPDDMSGIILASYHRNLNNKEIELQEHVKHYQSYWEKSKAEKQKIKQEVFLKYNIGDTLEFNYNNGFVSKGQEDKRDNNICIAKGIITERNEKDFSIMVKVFETCDKKGIIYYDNDGYKVYNTKTKKYSDPKRVIKKMKKGEHQWFQYKDWETIQK